MPAAMIRNERVVRTYRQTIEAPPEEVFPLLCPLREVEWLEGWDFKMVYSASGRVEEGAVFTTSLDGEADTVWLVTRLDQAAGLVEFARVTPGSRTCFLKLVVAPSPDGRTHVDVSYAYTSLGQAGDEFLEGWTNQAFLDGVIFWERSMNHFLKTGARLPRAAR